MTMNLWPRTWTPGSVEARVRAHALDVGFDEVGFARAGPVDSETASHYREWLSEGGHASMEYMERLVDERLNPLLILPAARSVIVLLSNYHRENPSEGQPLGKIAQYAGGRDYHRILGSRLRDLKARIAADHPGVESWYSVDSGPVLERYWAQRAGVGWSGKNTLTLNTRLGSWTFIGVLLTSLELEPNRPHPDHCGTCTRCLDACPTQAFPQPGVLDSRKCISYWTIEHRGELTAEMEANLHGWLFGCDVCQTVCPWNRHAHPTSVPDYLPRPPFDHPDVRMIAEMSREEWDEATKGTALRRAGYEGLVRNAKALSRMGD